MINQTVQPLIDLCRKNIEHNSKKNSQFVEISGQITEFRKELSVV
jgi:hypothetical protein